MELTPLALLDSMPDSSTTGYSVPITSIEHCSLGSQLHNGIRYVPTRWISMVFASVMRLVSMLTLSVSTPDSFTTRHLFLILLMEHCSPGSQLPNSIRYIPTQ